MEVGRLENGEAGLAERENMLELGEGMEAGVPEQGHSSLWHHLLAPPRGTQDPDLAGEDPFCPSLQGTVYIRSRSAATGPEAVHSTLPKIHRRSDGWMHDLLGYAHLCTKRVKTTALTQPPLS